MASKRSVLITMFVFSMLMHLLLAALWSANRLHGVQNMMNVSPRIFTVVRPSELPTEINPVPLQNVSKLNAPTIHQLKREKTTSEAALKTFTVPAASAASSTVQPIKPDSSADETANMPMGPFQSAIDPKKAWINVAESIEYSLLQGISIDISDGEYRLQSGLDTRVLATGDLTIEYPLAAAALGSEAVVYVLLLIDDDGSKSRVQVVRGDPDFDRAVLQALERVEFRPGVLRGEPVRSLMMLEFKFRRNPPEPGKN
jgi:periplasmic protein TonB